MNPTKGMWGFEYWDENTKRWDADQCGIQDSTNCFDTFEEASAELPSLADCMGCDVSLLRVAFLEVE